MSGLQLDLSCNQGTKVLEQDRSKEPWAHQPCILGIDEAGRGPVLGPMVYAAVYAPESLDLSKRSFADSKTLDAKQRDSLFGHICADTQLGFCAEVLSAAFICTNMLGKEEKVSLNVLANNSTYKIIQTVLDRGVKLTHVYIDTVGDAERYEARLSLRFPTLKFTVCPKADALYPVVSAASIVAKVTRDRALETCQADAGIPTTTSLGTGYPADPDTKAFLRASLDPVFGFKHGPLVRFSWETCARLMTEEGCVPLQFEADVEDGGGTQQRISFAAPSQANVVETSAVGRHAYFRARKLQRLGECF